MRNTQWLRQHQFVRMSLYLAVTLGLIYGILRASSWLDTAVTGLQGGQVLQGGSFRKALTVSFRDARFPERPLPVEQVQFKNVDRFLPVDIIVHTQGRDSTFFPDTRAEQVQLGSASVDSLTIRTRNTGHSVSIDNLSFRSQGRTYRIDFDETPEGASLAPNSQLLEYRTDGVLVRFGADNAVPTVVRGGDLAESIGHYIFEASGPISTVLILSLIAVPFWMIFRFARAMSQDLAQGRFFTDQDAQAAARCGADVFQDGRFVPEGRGYVFKKGTELYRILTFVGPEVARNRLVEYCTEKIDMLFEEIEDRLTEVFGMAGVLALSVGLLGTVIGMIEAFKILENSMKVGQGPAQIQLKMAHYINFALVTTAAGFMGRILSLVLIRKIKARILQNRSRMIDLAHHFYRHAKGQDANGQDAKGQDSNGKDSNGQERVFHLLPAERAR